MAHIHYITKSNNREYASLATSARDGKRVGHQYLSNLGLVVDKEKGIFRSRERGLFHYTLESGFSGLPEGYVREPRADEKEKLILDFGDSFFLWEYMKAQTFLPALRAVLPEQSDTLFSLLFFRMLTDKKACCHAETWYQGNYVSLLFPQARIRSQRISEFLAAVGAEDVQRSFFSEYLRCLYEDGGATGILIDSSGLPNDSKLSVTQISNHNGNISLEARLIYVLDRKTGMPIYFRYCPGNVVDVTTLCTTLAELKQYRVDIDYAILDAGYFSEVNVRELFRNHVGFVTRLAPNRRLFKDVAYASLPSLMDSENAVRYGNRLVYIRKGTVDIYGNTGFAYVGIDMDSRSQQLKRAAFSALDDHLSPKDMDDKMARLGLFMLVSSENIPIDEVLPLYYTRQQIEQVFDVGKNGADLLPIRIQTEETFRGHLMLTFLATVVLQKLQRDIIKKSRKKDKINPEGATIVLRNQKCKVFDEVIVPQEAIKSVNDVYRLFGIHCPAMIAKCSENSGGN
jgi:hypothetical protein